MQIARRLALAALFFAVLVMGWRFAADHSSEVVIRTPVSSGTHVSLWVALLASFGLGVVLTGTIATVRLARQGLLSRRYRSVIRGLESEVHQLRNLPLGAGDLPPDDLPPAGGSSVPEAPASGRALGRGA